GHRGDRRARVALVPRRRAAHDGGMFRRVAAAVVALAVVACATGARGDDAVASDSLRAARHHHHSGGVWDIMVDDDRAPRHRKPSAPYSRGVHWPDRPLQGFGTHVPRRHDGELETEFLSYARTVRTVQ